MATIEFGGVSDKLLRALSRGTSKLPLRKRRNYLTVRESFILDQQCSEWHHKRDRIVDRDGCCLVCGSVESLHVHHGYPDPQLRAWLFDDANLHTMCSSCHGSVGKRLFSIQRNILRMMGTSVDEALYKKVEAVVSAMMGVPCQRG